MVPEATHPPRASAWTPVLSGPARDAACTAAADIARALADGTVTPPGSRHPGSDASLAGGQAGLSLFFHYMSSAGAGGDYAAHAAAALGRATDAMASFPMSPGLFGGFPGIGYAVAHLKRRGFGPAVELDLSDIDEAVLGLARTSPWHLDYDLITGLVGLGVYALERLPDPVAAECLEQVVARLAELAERRAGGITWFTPPYVLTPQQREIYPTGYYNLGLAHGVPGIVGLLARVYTEAAPSASVGELLDGAVRWLVAQQRRDGSGSWFGTCLTRETQVAHPARTAWCYGDPGVAASLLSAGRAAGAAEWEEMAVQIARAAAARTLEESGVVDSSLCHGAAGLAHIHARFYNATGNEAFAEAARAWIGHLLAMRRPGHGIAGFEYRQYVDAGRYDWVGLPGLLEGAAGIGLVLLAACAPEEPAWDRVFLVDVASPRAAFASAP